MSVPNLRHPYHLPACYDGDTDKGPGNLTLKYVKEIYDDVIFSGFSNSNDEVTTDPRYYRINELHHDAFRKTSMTDIFDEVFILPLMPERYLTTECLVLRETRA